MQRVLICGDREWDDASLFQSAMRRWVAEHGRPDAVIEGCARGADRMAEQWAADHGVPVEHYPADWKRIGRAAGPVRNQQMLVEGKPDAVIAFHDDIANSRGTADMVRRARKANVLVWTPADHNSDEHDQSNCSACEKRWEYWHEGSAT